MADNASEQPARRPVRIADNSSSSDDGMMVGDYNIGLLMFGLVFILLLLFLVCGGLYFLLSLANGGSINSMFFMGTPTP